MIIINLIQSLKAYDVGLLGACHGETREIIAPPPMAFGEAGRPKQGILSDTILHFTVEILEIRKDEKNMNKEMDPYLDYDEEIDEDEESHDEL